MRRLRSPRGRLSVTPTSPHPTAVCLCAPPPGPGALPSARHLCGSPLLCLSLSLFSKCLLSTFRVFLPLCVSPPTFSPLGTSLHFSSSISLESPFLSVCLTFSGSPLCLSFPISLSVSRLPPIPFSSPPSTSPVCQVSRDPKQGRPAGQSGRGRLPDARPTSQRDGGRTPVPWEGSHPPHEASTLRPPS